MFIDILGREEGGERQREKHQCKKHQLPPYTTWPGTEPTTQACALIGNQT